jgi:predicted dehydrogenase
MLKVAVAGVGHLGKIHAKLWKEVERAELVGVFDVDRDEARRVAALHDVRAFETIDELLSAVDALSIVTPTFAHHETAMRAIDAGKHVLIEKPITTTTAQAMEIIQAARSKNVRVQVGHVERFNPALLAAEGYLRNPQFFESHRMAQFKPRGTDVAVVLDLMVHDIDVILSLVKSPVRSVDASGVAIVSEQLDIANARIKFENGAVANVTASRISQTPLRKLRVFDNDAYLSIDFGAKSVDVFRLGDPSEVAAPGAMTLMLGEIEKGNVPRSIVYEKPDVREVNPLKYELELFREAIEGATTPIVSGEDGLMALEVAERIMRSIETGEVA